MWDDTEDQTKGMNGDKTDMNDKRKPEEGPRNKNTGLHKIENKKQVRSEGEQYTFRKKLQEDLHVS